MGHPAMARVNDRCLRALETHRDNTLRGYLIYQDKRPVMLLKVTDEMIYAYAYKEFKAQLSKRGHASPHQR